MMITLLEVKENMEANSKIQSERRYKELHLSGIAICGLKYAYEVDNNINVPFRDSMKMGLAFEDGLYWEVKKLNKTYLHNYPLYLNVQSFYPSVAQFIAGTPDYISFYEKHIIEVKTSHGSAYEDIYIRQLKAYMIGFYLLTGLYPIGSLWNYNKGTDKLTEKNILPEQITTEDWDLIAMNFDGYFTNTYHPIMKNSLCKFCKNTRCPGNPKHIDIVDTNTESDGDVD